MKFLIALLVAVPLISALPVGLQQRNADALNPQPLPPGRVAPSGSRVEARATIPKPSLNADATIPNTHIQARATIPNPNHKADATIPNTHLQAKATIPNPNHRTPELTERSASPDALNPQPLPPGFHGPSDE